MPVYFVIERPSDNIKIGVSVQIRKRLAQLQTGNPNKLELMGWITPKNDRAIEKALHKKYQDKRGLGGGGKEWFTISQDVVLRELKQAQGFIPRNVSSFEVIGYDPAGVPA